MASLVPHVYRKTVEARRGALQSALQTKGSVISDDERLEPSWPSSLSDNNPTKDAFINQAWCCAKHFHMVLALSHSPACADL